MYKPTEDQLDLLAKIVLWVIGIIVGSFLLITMIAMTIMSSGGFLIAIILSVGLFWALNRLNI